MDERRRLKPATEFNCPCFFVHHGERGGVHAKKIRCRRHEDAVLVPALANVQLITRKIVALLKGAASDKSKHFLTSDLGTAHVSSEHKQIHANCTNYRRDGSYDQALTHRPSVNER